MQQKYEPLLQENILLKEMSKKRVNINIYLKMPRLNVRLLFLHLNNVLFAENKH